MKNKVKSKVLNNFGYKLLSVLFAIVLWLVVMNISDATITKQINGIPVEKLNGDVLDELDQIYDVVSGDTVDIVIKGRRSVVSALSKDDFRATVDLSTMSITNSVQIEVVAKKSDVNDAVTITCKDSTMKLNLEEKVKIQYPVKIKTSGTPRDGYAVGGYQVNPSIVTIEGPKSSVDKITEVVVTVAADGVKEDYKQTGNIVLYDAYGDEIKNDKIQLSVNEVEVSVVIYPVKAVDIEVEVSGTPKDGYGVANVVYQPQTIRIAGEPEVLAKIDKVKIDDIHISGISEDYQTTIELNKYLDDGVIIADSDSQIVVTVDIEELEEKTYSVSDKVISLKNKKTGYKYRIKLTDDCKVVLSGMKDEVDLLALSDVGLYIDCSELGLGVHENVELGYNTIENVDCELHGTATVEVYR